MIKLRVIPVRFNGEGPPTFQWISWNTLTCILAYSFLFYGIPNMPKLYPPANRNFDTLNRALVSLIGTSPTDWVSMMVFAVSTNLIGFQLILLTAKAVPHLWEIINLAENDIETIEISSMKPKLLKIILAFELPFQLFFIAFGGLAISETEENIGSKVIVIVSIAWSSVVYQALTLPLKLLLITWMENVTKLATNAAKDPVDEIKRSSLRCLDLYNKCKRGLRGDAQIQKPKKVRNF